MGGAAETYWKSSSTSAAVQPERPRLGLGRGLVQQSPRGVNIATPTASTLVTSSSLSGEYLAICVQVTKDLIPVISDVTTLHDQVISLTIADVTYLQLIDLHGNSVTHGLRQDVKGNRTFSLSPFLKFEQALQASWLASVTTLLLHVRSNCRWMSIFMFKSHILERIRQN